MFSYIKKITGNITVRENDGIITVEGVPGYVIRKDIKNIWGTDKVNANMFLDISNNSFSFLSFYATDVLFTLEQLTHSTRSLKVSLRTLEKVKNRLLEHTWLARTLKEAPKILDRSKLKELVFDPLEHQTAFFNVYEQNTFMYGLNGMLLAAAAGSGKAQPLDALIKVPGGWSTMGAMTIGTEVIAKDGSVTKVNAIYPQGQKEIFKITFSDGRSTECCADHLWNITRPKKPNQHFKETVSTKQLIEYKKTASLRDRLYIDLIDSEQNNDIELPIDPYLLGVFLGDGCGRSVTPTITTPDEFIVNEISSLLPLGNKLIKRIYKDKCPSYGIIKTEYNSNIFKKFLIDNNLFYKMSYDKFIPEIYLHASTKQRLHLLQGLLDTDGTIDTQGTVSFISSSELLSLGVQYLVRSLGGLASVSIKHPNYTYLGQKLQGRLAYQVNIRYKKQSELFRLPKKKDRTNDNNQYAANLKLRIDKIESIGFKEAQCISIDNSDHLYITDQFIVTHNTFTSLALTNMLDVDIVIVICPKAALIKVWQESIKTLFHKYPHYWISSQQEEPRGNERFYVAHYEALSKMLEIAKDFKNKKVAVILDESHNLNETTSLRANYFVDLCNLVNSKHTIWLSGTPFKALAIESVPLLRSIDPLFTKEVELGFRKIFGKSNTRAVEILNNRLGLISFKVEKKELKLREPIFSEIKVKTTNAQEYTLINIKKIMREFIKERQEYYEDRKKQDEAFFQECLDLYSKTLVSKLDILDYKEYLSCLKIVISSGGDFSAKAEIVFCNRYEHTKIIPNLPNDRKAIFRDTRSIVKYVGLKIQGEALGRVFGKMRAQCHVDMIDHIDFEAICQSTVKKTVVFTSFVQVVEKAQKYLSEKGLNPLVVYGKTNVNLAAIVSSFESNESLNPLIATYKSLSTAVPLVMADTMILIDAPFRDHILQQAVSRIHRLGSDTQTYIYTCSLDTGDMMNISTRSFEILKDVQAEVEKIIGIKSPFNLTDNPEEFAYALEGLDLNVLEPIGNLKPSFLSW